MMTWLEDSQEKFNAGSKPKTNFSVDTLFTKGSERQLEITTKKDTIDHCQRLFPYLKTDKQWRFRQTVEDKDRRKDIKNELVYLLNKLYELPTSAPACIQVQKLEDRNEKNPFEVMISILRSMIDPSHTMPPPPHHCAHAVTGTHDIAHLAVRIKDMELAQSKVEEKIGRLEEAVHTSPAHKARRTDERGEELACSLPPNPPPPAMNVPDELDDFSCFSDMVSSITLSTSGSSSTNDATNSSLGTNYKGTLKELIERISDAPVEYVNEKNDGVYKSSVTVRNVRQSFSVQSTETHTKKKDAINDAHDVLFPQLKSFLEVLNLETNSNFENSNQNAVSRVKELLDRHKFERVCKPKSTTSVMNGLFSASVDLTIVFGWCTHGYALTKKSAEQAGAQQMVGMLQKLKGGDGSGGADSFDQCCRNVSYDGGMMSVGNSTLSSNTLPSVSSARAGEMRVAHEEAVQKRFGCGTKVKYNLNHDEQREMYQYTVSVVIPFVVSTSGSEKQTSKDAKSSAAEVLLGKMKAKFQAVGKAFIPSEGTSSRQKLDNFLLKNFSTSDPPAVVWNGDEDCSINSGQRMWRYIASVSTELVLTPLEGKPCKAKKRAQLDAIERFSFANGCGENSAAD